MAELHAADSGPAHPNRAGKLCAIVYVSKAARAVTPADLQQILESSRRRNTAESITGALLYANGYFMQYLEGPEAGLHRVYALIKTHPLHYGLIDLVREPIQKRAFAEWSMACPVVDGATGSPLSNHYGLLTSRLTAAVHTQSQACLLMSHFWAAGPAAVAPVLLQRSQTLAQRRPDRP